MQFHSTLPQGTSGSVWWWLESSRLGDHCWHLVGRKQTAKHPTRHRTAPTTNCLTPKFKSAKVWKTCSNPWLLNLSYPWVVLFSLFDLDHKIFTESSECLYISKVKNSLLSSPLFSWNCFLDGQGMAHAAESRCSKDSQGACLCFGNFHQYKHPEGSNSALRKAY